MKVSKVNLLFSFAFVFVAMLVFSCNIPEAPPREEQKLPMGFVIPDDTAIAANIEANTLSIQYAMNSVAQSLGQLANDPALYSYLKNEAMADNINGNWVRLANLDLSLFPELTSIVSQALVNGGDYTYALYLTLPQLSVSPTWNGQPVFVMPAFQNGNSTPTAFVEGQGWSSVTPAEITSNLGWFIDIQLVAPARDIPLPHQIETRKPIWSERCPTLDESTAGSKGCGSGSGVICRTHIWFLAVGNGFCGSSTK
ncbi:MAG: hypothetical protein H6581_16700 [Bacteroidia bacterium]|nr:hypothetical protein [Bacteroidia bacterium]